MFHSILRKLREDIGYSQKEFADMLSIPVTTYRNYENTQREPSYDILIKISELLGVTTDELLGVDKTQKKYNIALQKLSRLPEGKFHTAMAFIDFLLTS